MKLKALILLGCASAAIGRPAGAQETPQLSNQAPAEAGTAEEVGTDAVRADQIIVTGQLTFRNRTSDANPVLSYDLEYFQRFEPVSVGEMLKRVPGVTFTSDVLEYDGVQMRGLPSGFTQVLINGRRAPGGEADRSFFVDRVPAELVERIEIIRAPRADQPSEGIAGTLNIVTKESVSFRGGFAKLGALINGDGEVRPSAAIAYAGQLGPDTSLWGALNYQERRNPKKKVSLRFSDEPSGAGDETDPEFDNIEFQDDTRDGRDLSGNAELTHRFGDGGLVRAGGFFVDTDRDEDETSATYEGPELEFDEVELQHEEIAQETYALTADSVIPVGAFRVGLAGGWTAFRENTDIEIHEGDNEEDFDDVELTELEELRIRDDEYSGTASLTFGHDTPVQIKGGIDLLAKRRRGANSVTDVEDDETEENPTATFRIRERRYDPYLRATFEPSSDLTIDAGLRYEITRRRVVGTEGSASYDAESLNPSLHARYSVTPRDQLRVSVARTARRPNYDLISPYEQEESPGDEDITVGNPALENERAWGVDAGYERRLGSRGIFGVNLFYRKIRDLTELVAIGDVTDEDDEGEEVVVGSIYTPRNIGDGKTWGLELDFSAPLDVLGLPETGLFANYTYLDSSTRDPFTGEKRRFNHQPHHIYNVGFIQNLRALDASFGASLSGRSKSLESNFDETVKLTYTPDLEAFVEKRIGRHLVLRLTGQNLLNRAKRETFRKYDGDNLDEVLENRAAGDLDEFEKERERSGRLIQVTARVAF